MNLAILIPVHNAAATIERTIQSLAHVSDRAGTQVIIVDDGSTDDSAAIAERALDQQGFAARQILRQDNAGAGAARNTALANTSAAWVLFLDADDELLIDPSSLFSAVPRDATVVTTGAVVVRRGAVVKRYRPQIVTVADARRRLSAGNLFPMGSVLFRRDQLTHCFDETLAYLEDWQFWLHNEQLYQRVVAVNERMVRIHVHGGNRSSHFAAIGACRERIAEGWYTSHRPTMTRQERHNWMLQRAIGRMLQGHRPSLAAWFAWRANKSLYVKFMAHACLRQRVLRHDHYAVGR